MEWIRSKNRRIGQWPVLGIFHRTANVKSVAGFSFCGSWLSITTCSLGFGDPSPYTRLIFWSMASFTFVHWVEICYLSPSLFDFTLNSPLISATQFLSQWSLLIVPWNHHAFSHPPLHNGWSASIHKCLPHCILAILMVPNCQCLA